MNKKRLGFVLLPLLLVALWPASASGYLSDLWGHWSAGLVTTLEARGIVSGDDQGEFNPDSPLTRAELAKLLAAALGYDADAAMLQDVPSRFSDVPTWHWARGYIEVMAEVGIVAGYPGGSFAPDAPVSRAEIAALAVRAAGLEGQAQLASGPTGYADDALIPDWARGSIGTARTEGLMQGLPDGRFQPDRPVTRAEGAAVVYRLLARNGALFHLSGTLTAYDAERRTGTIRDGAGQEHSFRMAARAVYLRDGAVVTAADVRLYDEAEVLLDDTGRGQLMEVGFTDLVAAEATVEGSALRLLLPSGAEVRYSVLPGALILVNGQAATLTDLAGAGPLWAAVDSNSGALRIVQALKNARGGFYVGPAADGQELRFVIDDADVRYTPAPSLVVLLEGERVGLDELLPGDEVLVALDSEGRLAYVELLR